MDQSQWLLEAANLDVPLDKWQETINVLAEACDVPAAFIVQSGPSGLQVTSASQGNKNPYGAGLYVDGDQYVFCQEVVLTGQALSINDARSMPKWRDNPEVKDGFTAYYGLPIRWPDGTIFGTICIMDYEEQDYGAKYGRLVAQFQGLIEKDLEILTNYAELRAATFKDELTNLYNRRGFKELAAQRVSMNKRHNYQFAIILFDLDGLKTINALHGHERGDQAIQIFAETLRANTRGEDVIARIGGDEFAVIIFQQNPAEAQMFLRRISKALQDRIYEEEGLSELTFHTGAAHSQDFTSLDVEKMINRADESMAEDKESDRQSAWIS